MTEPIRPEDHSIEGRASEDYVALGQRRRPDERFGLSTLAIIEAIHQTFERDAEAVKQFNRSIYSAPEYPDTETDRQARLIVDGEYRRRANKGTEAERDD